MLVMVDLDNTLVDRASAVDEWAIEFVSEHGLDPVVADQIVALDADGYADRREVFTTLRSSLRLDASVDALLDAYRSRIVELARLVEGAAECLIEFSDRGWSVAIVSNGSSRQQHAKIDALGLRSLVDAVVVSGDHGVAKPEREIFELAARRTGHTVVGAWMVGDSIANDVIGPAHVGMRTAWITRGRPWDDDDVRPDLIVESLGGLAARIASVE